MYIYLSHPQYIYFKYHQIHLFHTITSTFISQIHGYARLSPLTVKCRFTDSYKRVLWIILSFNFSLSCHLPFLLGHAKEAQAPVFCVIH